MTGAEIYDDGQVYVEFPIDPEMYEFSGPTIEDLRSMYEKARNMHNNLIIYAPLIFRDITGGGCGKVVQQSYQEFEDELHRIAGIY